MRATRHYDPHRGRFQTYAVFWLQQAIGRYLLKRGHLVTPPSQMLQAGRKVARMARALEAQLERAPTAEELAEVPACPSKRSSRRRKLPFRQKQLRY